MLEMLGCTTTQSAQASWSISGQCLLASNIYVDDAERGMCAVAAHRPGMRMLGWGEAKSHPPCTSRLRTPTTQPRPSHLRQETVEQCGTQIHTCSHRCSQDRDSWNKLEPTFVDRVLRRKATGAAAPLPQGRFLLPACVGGAPCRTCPMPTVVRSIVTDDVPTPELVARKGLHKPSS